MRLTRITASPREQFVADSHEHGIGYGDRPYYPELLGKLTGVAVRVPLLNASLTDCVFEMQRATTVDEVNTAFKACGGRKAAGGHSRLRGPAVRVGRFQGRSALGDCRWAVHDGGRRHLRQSARVV